MIQRSMYLLTLLVVTTWNLQWKRFLATQVTKRSLRQCRSKSNGFVRLSNIAQICLQWDSCIRSYKYTYVRYSVRTCGHTYRYSNIHTYACTYTYMYISIHMYVRMYADTNIHMISNVRTHVLTCMCSYHYVRMRIHVLTHVR